MLSGISLDQLQTFIAAAEAGSFSAAGRRLRRAQSVVSQTLANLESQINVSLFARTRGSRRPELTDAGQALLIEARAIADGIDAFKARAKGLAAGLEPEVSVVVDVMFPMETLTAAVSAFHAQFPQLMLRLYVDALGAVAQPVLDGQCAVGIMGSLPVIPTALSVERLFDVPMAMVASPRHPLASWTGPIRRDDLAKHVQLVLTDRSDLSRGREFGVMAAQTWRLSDLGAKHAFLRAALGWGSMPLSVVAADLRDGTLVRLDIDGVSGNYEMQMSAVYRRDAPPGPAGRWLIDWLRRID